MIRIMCGMNPCQCILKKLAFNWQATSTGWVLYRSHRRFYRRGFTDFSWLLSFWFDMIQVFGFPSWCDFFKFLAIRVRISYSRFHRIELGLTKEWSQNELYLWQRNEMKNEENGRKTSKRRRLIVVFALQGFGRMASVKKKRMNAWNWAGHAREWNWTRPFFFPGVKDEIAESSLIHPSILCFIGFRIHQVFCLCPFHFAIMS